MLGIIAPGTLTITTFGIPSVSAPCTGYGPLTDDRS
jgi:hypothetical protein